MEWSGQRCLLLPKRHDHTCQGLSLKKKAGIRNWEHRTWTLPPGGLCVAHRELAQCLNIFQWAANIKKSQCLRNTHISIFPWKLWSSGHSEHTDALCPRAEGLQVASRRSCLRTRGCQSLLPACSTPSNALPGIRACNHQHAHGKESNRMPLSTVLVCLIFDRHKVQS